MSLDQLTTANGVFTILAIDHRDSLLAELPGSPTPEDVTALKRDVIATIGPAASGVMLETEYSIPQCLEVLPDGVGFFCALEAQGYGSDAGSKPTEILVSPPEAKSTGASGAKLLVHYNPDHADHAAAQEAIVRDVVAECQQAGFPLLLEPLFFGLDDPVDRTRIVLETTARLSGLGASIMKLPFPVDMTVNPNEDEWKAACRSITETSPVPWALLTAGDPFDRFVTQLETACAAGCSGFMAGRAVWRQAVKASADERRRVLQDVALPRFRRLAAIASETGRPVS